jgi:hypothetical protein
MLHQKKHCRHLVWVGPSSSLTPVTTIPRQSGKVADEAVRLCRYVKTPELWASLAVTRPWRYSLTCWICADLCGKPNHEPSQQSTIWGSFYIILNTKEKIVITPLLGILPQSAVMYVALLSRFQGHGYSPKGPWHRGNRSLIAAICCKVLKQGCNMVQGHLENFRDRSNQHGKRMEDLAMDIAWNLHSMVILWWFMNPPLFTHRSGFINRLLI